MRVVFMGTPDIAATCLEKILADGFDVVGVYTQPDRPKGRGMKLVASPVGEAKHPLATAKQRSRQHDSSPIAGPLLCSDQRQKRSRAGCNRRPQTPHLTLLSSFPSPEQLCATLNT